MSEAVELASCPFCGGPAEIWRASPGTTRKAWIACMGRCVAISKEHETDAEAIAAWNRRALTKTEGEPVAWLGTTADGWSDVTQNADNIAVWRGYGRHVQPLYTRPPVWPDREAVARVLFPHIYPQTAQLLDYDQVRAGLALGSMGGGMDDLNAAADAVIALLPASDGAGQVEGENP